MVGPSFVHEVCAHEAGEREWAFDLALVLTGHRQQKVSNESDRDLNAHSILGCSQKVADALGLLDPAEK